MSKPQHFQVSLPVFKQGDDFSEYLDDDAQNPAKAFIGLAEQYEEAARVCRRVATVIEEPPLASQTEAYGDTHFVGLTCPSEVVAQLISENVVTLVESEEELEEELEAEDELEPEAEDAVVGAAQASEGDPETDPLEEFWTPST